MLRYKTLILYILIIHIESEAIPDNRETSYILLHLYGIESKIDSDVKLIIISLKPKNI